MEITLNELSPTRCTVDVTFPWDQVSTAIEAEVKRVAARAKVKGFRPGKAPIHIVKSLYGNDLRSQAGQALFEKGLQEAATQHKLRIMGYPSLERFELKDGSPMRFTARLEVAPKIAELSYTGLAEVVREEVSFTDEELNARLERLRRSHGEVVTPEPARPAQEGDVVTFDLKQVTADGQPRADLETEEADARLAEDEGLDAELIPHFVGMSEGESKQVSWMHEEGEAQLKLEAELSLKRVRALVLPELDDEFAKDLGDYASLDAYKSSLREREEKERGRQADEKYDRALLDAFADANPIEAPDSVVQRRLKELQDRRIQLEQLLAQIAPGRAREAQADAEEELAQATRDVRLSFLMGHIVERFELSVTDEDVDAAIADEATRRDKHPAWVRAEIEREQRLDGLKDRALERKILAKLREEAGL